jgi:hypothetical protein
LVHGARADGSSWAAVIRRLQAADHQVVAPQLRHTSLADNVAKLRRDEGESIGALLGQGPPTPAIASLQVERQGFA